MLHLTILSWQSWWKMLCVTVWYTPQTQFPVLSKIRIFPNILITSAFGGRPPAYFVL